NIGDFLAHRCLVSHGDGLVADLVGILGHGAVEPALADGVLLGSAGVEASDDRIRILAAVGQIHAVGNSGQEAGNGTLVGAEDRLDAGGAQQGVGSGLDSGSLSGGGDLHADDDGGVLNLLLPLAVALDGDGARLIGLGDFRHLV